MGKDMKNIGNNGRCSSHNSNQEIAAYDYIELFLCQYAMFFFVWYVLRTHVLIDYNTGLFCRIPVNIWKLFVYLELGLQRTMNGPILHINE